VPDAQWLPGGVRGMFHCATCGASTLRENLTQHENFHKTYTYRRDGEMSNVSWCDYGDHAFKTGSTGAASFEVSEINDEGQSVRTTMDACGEHNPLNVRREAARYQLTPEAYEVLNKAENSE
jgi:hypothetical protein